MPAKYVRHELHVPIDIWDEIVKIAYREWDEEEKIIAQKLSLPGISPNAPKNKLINDLLREALFERLMK